MSAFWQGVIVGMIVLWALFSVVRKYMPSTVRRLQMQLADRIAGSRPRSWRKTVASRVRPSADYGGGCGSVSSGCSACSGCNVARSVSPPVFPSK